MYRGPVYRGFTEPLNTLQNVSKTVSRVVERTKTGPPHHQSEPSLPGHNEATPPRLDQNERSPPRDGITGSIAACLIDIDNTSTTVMEREEELLEGMFFRLKSQG